MGDFSKGGVHKTDGVWWVTFQRGEYTKPMGFDGWLFKGGSTQNRWLVMDFGNFLLSLKNWAPRAFISKNTVIIIFKQKFTGGSFFGGGSSHHRPVIVKPAGFQVGSDRLSASIKARPKNLGADTHPLARKFLLVISTIAFLCGWY